MCLSGKRNGKYLYCNTKFFTQIKSFHLENLHSLGPCISCFRQMMKAPDLALTPFEFSDDEYNSNIEVYCR